jgi:hypothetical protein
MLRSGYSEAFVYAASGHLANARESLVSIRRQAQQVPLQKGSDIRIRLSGATFDAETATPADFEREAAYQHAVLTAAIGEKPAAAKEYLAIINEFPESEQAAKAIRRLAKLHGGELLPHEQKAWEAAQKTARDNARACVRARSLCGPEVVAELLRRGESQSLTSLGSLSSLPTLPSLAQEMKADEFGVTLKSMQQALIRRGYWVKGLKLTLPALWNKKLPAVALLKEGHFVLVDRIADGTVETWDPDLDGSGSDGAKTYHWPHFEKAWTGMALILD